MQFFGVASSAVFAAFFAELHSSPYFAALTVAIPQLLLMLLLIRPYAQLMFVLLIFATSDYSSPSALYVPVSACGCASLSSAAGFPSACYMSTSVEDCAPILLERVRRGLPGSGGDGDSGFLSVVAAADPSDPSATSFSSSFNLSTAFTASFVLLLIFKTELDKISS